MELPQPQLPHEECHHLGATIEPGIEFPYMVCPDCGQKPHFRFVVEGHLAELRGLIQQARNFLHELEE